MWILGQVLSSATEEPEKTSPTRHTTCSLNCWCSRVVYLRFWFILWQKDSQHFSSFTFCTTHEPVWIVASVSCSQLAGVSTARQLQGAMLLHICNKGLFDFFFSLLWPLSSDLWYQQDNFSSHSDAQCELQQAVLLMSTCLNLASKTNWASWTGQWVFAMLSFVRVICALQVAGMVAQLLLKQSQWVCVDTCHVQMCVWLLYWYSSLCPHDKSTFPWGV